MQIATDQLPKHMMTCSGEICVETESDCKMYVPKLREQSKIHVRHEAPNPLLSKSRMRKLTTGLGWPKQSVLIISWVKANELEYRHARTRTRPKTRRHAKSE